MRCDIEVTINGVKRTFHSDEALDAYIFKRRDVLQKFLDVIDPTFSASSVTEDVISRLKELQKTTSSKVNADKHVRVTEALKYLTKAPVFDDFDEDDYRKQFEAKIKEQNPTITQKELDELFKNPRTMYSEIGTDIHYGLEMFFKGDPINISNLKTLSAEKVNVARTAIGSKVIDHLNRSFGKDENGKPKWSTFSEFTVRTKDFDEGKMRDIEAHLRIGNPNIKRIEEIKGTIDLIVVDSSGSLHLYDFKTSKHKYSDWPKSKRDGVIIQLETYAAILRQMGFNVASCNVIPIDVDEYGNAELKGIEQLPYDPRLLRKVNELIPNREEVKVDGIKTTNDIVRTFYPQGNVDSIAVRKNADVEQYRKKVYKINPDAGYAKYPEAAGKTHYFIDTLKEGRSRFVFCNGEDDIRAKLSDYVNRINEERSKELLLFGQRLTKWIKNRDLSSLETYTGMEKNDVNHHLQFQFRKYIVNGWNLINSDVLFENGFLLFEKNGRVEIVIIDTMDLNTVIPLKKGKSILGTVRDETDVTDNSKVLDSRRGHMLLTKALAFINENQDLFKNRKIQTIKAINLHDVESISVANSKLMSNWKLLVASFPQLKLKLFENLFMKDANSFLHQANDCILSFEYQGLSETAQGLEFRKDDHLRDINKDFARSALLKFITQFRQSLKLYSIDKMSATKDWEMPAFNMLLQAYLSTFDVTLSAQEDLGPVWTGKKGVVGTKITPMGVSQSGTLRSLEEINSLFERNVEYEFKKRVTPWQLKLKKIYEKPGSRYSKSKGSSYFFERWFEIDEITGEIDRRFILKDPSELPPDEAELCDLFLKTLAEFRGWSEEEIEKRKITKEYYQVPLIKGRFLETIRHKGGVKNALKNSIDRIANIDLEKSLGISLTETQKEALNDLSIVEIDNHILNMDPEHRTELLEKDMEQYSTDIDLIFLTTLEYSLRSKMSRAYLPALTAFRVYLEMENATNGKNSNKNTREAVKDWMKTVVFGKTLIDEHQLPLARAAAAIRTFTSAITLSMSTTALSREGLTSTIVNFINSQNGLDPDINAKDLANAYVDVVQDLKHTADITSKDQQFNTLFGVAEMSFSQMSRSNRTNPYGFGNIDGDIWFVTTTAMDYAHRNAILKCKLKARGAYDAYSLDDDGALVYDFEKDEQWSLIRKYKTVNECPKEQRNEWFKQDDHYKESIKSWNKFVGMDLKYGDPLPQALNPDELDGLRIFINLLHGFYDDSQKVLMQKELLGGLFLQFKTVPLARWQMQNHPTQSINMRARRLVKDENGKQIYEVINEENIAIGYMSEGEEGLDELIEKGLARPFYQIQGNPLIGKVEETLEVGGTFLKCLKDGDFAALKEHFNNPFRRRTLFIALWDLLGMTILSFLINLSFGEDMQKNIKEVSALKRYAWAVATGITSEGPVWKTADAILGDGTLPFVSITGRFIDTTMGIVTGNTPVVYGLMSSFGATRPWSNLAYE